MNITSFFTALSAHNIGFFTGVPDSLLQPFCDYLYDNFTTNGRHIVAANEGGGVGIAAGYHLATGKIPCVYMQNSGIGNAANPIISLTNDKVYAIPMLFVVGFRGEPNVKDEPQHVFQGEITLPLLALLDVETAVIDSCTTTDELEEILAHFEQRFSIGKSAAIVVKKGAFVTEIKTIYGNVYTLIREDVVGKIAESFPEACFVSTTGKISRELFELREKAGSAHCCDFLTVGSMGHSISIALGIAREKVGQTVVCIDGDGAALMQMGALAVVGHISPKNLLHFVLNNEAHETVGGMPNAAQSADFMAVALACGYKKAYCADTMIGVCNCISLAKKTDGPVMIEVKVALKSRADLMRPNTTPEQNKEQFMKFVDK